MLISVFVGMGPIKKMPLCPSIEGEQPGAPVFKIVIKSVR
jgi:hypothetical protein